MASSRQWLGWFASKPARETEESREGATKGGFRPLVMRNWRLSTVAVCPTGMFSGSEASHMFGLECSGRLAR